MDTAITKEMYKEMGIDGKVYSFGQEIAESLKQRFEEIDRVAEYNQLKVVHAMQQCRASEACLYASSGYGYNDVGRDTLEEIYAATFHTESALVRPQIACGTHALAVALAGNLRPGDELLVQVSRDAMKGKLPALTSNLNFTGRYLVLTTGDKKFGLSSKLTQEDRHRLSGWLKEEADRPDKEFGIIVRTNAADASKEEILSMYVSHAPFGGNVVGLNAASWRYFGHSAEDLSWAESAMLAVLPNAPAIIHLSKGRKTLLAKRNRLLKQLLDKEIIDSSTYELAVSEPLPDEPHPLPQIAPHLVSRFYQERNGRYSRTTIDKGMQTHIEDLAERWSNEFNRSDIRNLAILVIDIPSNQVVAYCGNVHFDRKQGGNQVDVIQAPRSTGSILKPFLYYAMLQEGSMLPDMLLPDVPVNAI